MVEMSVRERALTALEVKLGPIVALHMRSPADGGGLYGDEYEAVLDAVLEALREPDEGMVEAGRVAWLESASDYTRLDASNSAAFTAMIDHARNDGKE